MPGAYGTTGGGQRRPPKQKRISGGGSFAKPKVKTIKPPKVWDKDMVPEPKRRIKREAPQTLKPKKRSKGIPVPKAYSGRAPFPGSKVTTEQWQKMTKKQKAALGRANDQWHFPRI